MAWKPSPRQKQYARAVEFWDQRNPIYEGQDTFYGGPGQPAWPTWVLQGLPPKGAPHSIELRTFIAQNLHGTLLFVTPVGIPDGKQSLPSYLRRQKDNINLRSFLGQDLVNNVLFSKDKIYGEDGQVPLYEWVVPKSEIPAIDLRTYIDRPDRTLEGQDIIYSDPGQVPVYDWVVPKGYPHPISLRTYLEDLVNHTLRGQDIIYADPGQVPNYHWPVPKGYPFPVSLRTYLDDLIRWTLAGQDIFYGDPGQVPVHDVNTSLPAKGEIPAISLRTFLLGLVNTTLRGQDVVYGDPGQVPIRDYPLPPSVPKPLNVQDVANLLASLLAAPVGPPPKGMLPIQIARVRAIQAQLFGNLLLNTLQGQDIIYGDPGQTPAYKDFLVPEGYEHPISLRTFLQALVNLTLRGQDKIYGDPGQVPPYEWIVPKGYKHPTNLRTYAPRPDRTLDGQDRMYGDPGEVPTYDWLVPKGEVSALELRTFLAALVNSTLKSQDAMPVGEIEAQAPIALPKPMNLKDAQNLLTSLLSEVPFPTGKQLLPVQIARLRAIQAQLFADLLLTTLEGQDEVVPGEVDWKQLGVPIGHPRPVDVQQIQNLLNTLLSEEADEAEIRLAVTDIVLPALRKALIARESQITQNLLNSLLSVIEAIPQGKQEWPDSIAAEPTAIALKTFLLDLVNTTLLGQDKVYGDPGQVPAYDWQNPEPKSEFVVTLRTFIDRPDRTLEGQDILYGDPGQVPARVYDLPIAIPQPLNIQQVQDILNKLFIVELPPGDRTLPDRLITIKALPIIQQGQNIIETTLAVPPQGRQMAELPFYKAALTAVSAQAAADLLLNTLKQQDTIYGDPGQVPAYDLRLPRGYPFPTELRSHISLPNTDLLSIIRFPIEINIKLHSGRLNTILKDAALSTMLHSGGLTNVLKDATISIKNISGRLKIMVEKKESK